MAFTNCVEGTNKNLITLITIYKKVSKEAVYRIEFMQSFGLLYFDNQELISIITCLFAMLLYCISLNKCVS